MTLKEIRGLKVGDAFCSKNNPNDPFPWKVTVPWDGMDLKASSCGVEPGYDGEVFDRRQLTSIYMVQK